MNPAEPNLPPQSFLADAVSDEKATALEQLSAAWQLQISRLEEVLSTGWQENIQRVFDERFSELTRRLDQRFAADLEARVTEEVARAVEATRIEERESAQAAIAATLEESEKRTQAALAAALEEAAAEKQRAVQSAVDSAWSEARQELETAVAAAREQAQAEQETALNAAREEEKAAAGAALAAALEQAKEEALRETEAAAAAAREQAALELLEQAQRDIEAAVAAAREETAEQVRAEMLVQTDEAVNTAREQLKQEYEAAVAAACEESARTAREQAEQEFAAAARQEAEAAAAAARESAVREGEAAVEAAREEERQRAAEAVEAAVASAREQARREAIEELNRTTRRLRRPESRDEWTAALLEATSRFCRRAVVFTLRGHLLEGAGARGWENGDAPRIGGTEVPLAQAPAFANAVNSRDTIVSLRTAGELSPTISGLLGESGEQKAWLLPVLNQDRVAAILYAEGEDGCADLNGLEAVAAVAGASLAPRALPRGVPPVAGLSARSVSAAAAPSSQTLSSEEQDLHLKAQRFARVQVAEMRLYKSQAVKTGRAARNLYTGLKKEIDAARGAFEQQFVAPCPSMVDYLHLELVRTLANDDVALLGQNYPGPLV